MKVVHPGQGGRPAGLKAPNALAPAILLLLASCTFGGPSSPSVSRTSAAELAACRERADQVYEQQNRGDIYSPQPGINTPSSASYAPGITGRGLAQLYARDTMIRDCVRNTGAETDRGVEPGLRNTP